jgi:hypothetical protein
MPRTPASQWGILFNFAGGGLVHMETFPMAGACSCYTELLVAGGELVWADDDLIYIIVPM